MKKLDEKQIEDLIVLMDLVTSLLKGALHLGENNSKLSLAFTFLERLKKDLKGGKLSLEELPERSVTEKVSTKGEKRAREEKKGNSFKKGSKTS